MCVWVFYLRFTFIFFFRGVDSTVLTVNNIIFLVGHQPLMTRRLFWAKHPFSLFHLIFIVVINHCAHISKQFSVFLPFNYNHNVFFFFLCIVFQMCTQQMNGWRVQGKCHDNTWTQKTWWHKKGYFAKLHFVITFNLSYHFHADDIYVCFSFREMIIINHKICWIAQQEFKHECVIIIYP